MRLRSTEAKRHERRRLRYEPRSMRTAVLPSVRVERALRNDAESVLDEGETLSDFIATCVRGGIAWRRARDAFVARAYDTVDRSDRDSHGISPEDLLRRMDERLNAARSRLPGSASERELQ